MHNETGEMKAGRKDGCPCVPSDMVPGAYWRKKGQALFLYPLALSCKRPGIQKAPPRRKRMLSNGKLVCA
jgi:hypothetical protein